MANHKSAEKRNRQTATRSAINASRTSRIRTFVKKVEAAIAGGDYVSAKEALKNAQPEIMRGVSKGVLTLNTASRKISRLSSRVKVLKDAKAA
jgi:small subunit ribosomal protein S20